MIRDATKDDVAAMVALLLEFHGALAPGFAPDEEHLGKTVFGLVWSFNGFARVIDDGRLVGLLIGQAAQSPWGRFRVATELAWWVTPDARPCREAVALIRQFEAWARGQGCRYCALSSGGDANVERLYARLGYGRPEPTFSKELL